MKPHPDTSLVIVPYLIRSCSLPFSAIKTSCLRLPRRMVIFGNDFQRFRTCGTHRGPGIGLCYCFHCQMVYLPDWVISVLSNSLFCSVVIVCCLLQEIIIRGFTEWIVCFFPHRTVVSFNLIICVDYTGGLCSIN